MTEIAAACSGYEPEARLKELLRVEQAPSITGRFELPQLQPGATRERPWARGRILAARLRDALALGSRPLPSRRLADLLGMEESKLEAQPGSRLPVGVAIHRRHDGVSFVFRKKHPAARRFEAARWISEALVSSGSERWLASTDEKTSRQRFQRAFAAELLAPIDGVKELLDQGYSDDAIDEAAQHFNVSPLAIKSHLANHGEIPRAHVEGHSDF